MTTAWTLEQGIILRRTVLIGGLACFVFYYAFPAVGPIWFNWSATSQLPSVPRNCFPSMHFAWALMLAWNMRNRWLRLGFSYYAALIAISTLVLRQHYVIDLIAAVPYAIAVQWVALAWDRRGFNAKTESEFIALSSSDRA
jgi:membrane-associated phospholipid phosphatase